MQYLILFDPVTDVLIGANIGLMIQAAIYIKRGCFFRL